MFLVIILANLLLLSILSPGPFVYNILDILNEKYQFSGIFYYILPVKSYLWRRFIR